MVEGRQGLGGRGRGEGRGPEGRKGTLSSTLERNGGGRRGEYEGIGGLLDKEHGQDEEKEKEAWAAGPYS